MEGVCAALVAFLLAGLAIPRLVKNHRQYYSAVGMVAVVIFLQSLVAMAGSGNFASMLSFLIGILEICTLLLAIMSCGGLGGEWAGGVASGIEVIRRGEEEKSVIVPLSGEAHKTGSRPAQHRPSDEPPPVYRIDSPATAKPKVDDSSPIPLE